MPNLYPVFDTPSLAGRQPAQPKVGYGKAPAFDFERGDFILDGAGRVSLLDGHRAWVQWCAKAILTERYSALVYSPRYGVEFEQARRQPNRRAAEAAIERAITEALLVDRRTKAVRDFSFAWNGDELSISCTVVPTIGTDERIEVSLSG